MKKCANIFIFLFATLLFFACKNGGNKQQDNGKDDLMLQSVAQNNFVVTDTTFRFLLDSLAQNSPSLTINLSLETASDKQNHATEINNIIMYAVYGHEAYNPIEATRIFIDEISQEYYSLRADYINVRDVEESPVWLNHKYDIQGRVYEIHNDIINYIVQSDIYTGGTHSPTTRTYINIDARTGREIRLDDIFIEGYEEQLTNILTDSLLENYDEENIDEARRYITENIYPTENFILGRDSIIFMYNSYDIAPRSHKSTRIAISMNDIKDLLRTKEQE